jgi:hypothetical protein
MHEAPALFRAEALAHRRRGRAAQAIVFPRRALLRAALLLCLPLAALVAVLAAPQAEYREWRISGGADANAPPLRPQAAAGLRVTAWCLAGGGVAAPAHAVAQPDGVRLLPPANAAGGSWDRVQARVTQRFAVLLWQRLQAPPRGAVVQWRCAPAEE